MATVGVDRLWVSELVSEGFLALYSVEKVIESIKTNYQNVLIVEATPFGKCLIIDGKVQSSLLDEHIYHESLVHPALVTVGNPLNVLIIGGGEGATAREVLKWKTVESVVMVELDPSVVQLCRRVLPEMSDGVFEDRRFKLVVAEGRGYLESLGDGSLDAVVVDVTDPYEGAPSQRLYSQEFYKLVYRKLGDKRRTRNAGNLRRPQPPSPSSRFWRTMRTVFRCVTPLAAYVPSFSSLWGFVVGSKSRACNSLLVEQIDEILSHHIRRPSKVLFREKCITCFCSWRRHTSGSAAVNTRLSEMRTWSPFHSWVG
jgi:spermidine synthase